MKINKSKTILAALIMTFAFIGTAKADGPRVKFYNFADQLIDGEVRQPTTLYVDVRQKVKFRRLLRLKRDLLGRSLQNTTRNRIFK